MYVRMCVLNLETTEAPPVTLDTGQPFLFCLVLSCPDRLTAETPGVAALQLAVVCQSGRIELLLDWLQLTSTRWCTYSHMSLSLMPSSPVLIASGLMVLNWLVIKLVNELSI